MSGSPNMTWEAAVLSLINAPEQRSLVEACYFDAPLAAAAERYRQGDEWRAVRALLAAAGGRALDLGAGNGIAAYALARDGWTVDAVEPDPSTLVGAGAIRGLAAECGLPIIVTEQWGEALPFPDGHFDLVIARQVLHHARSLPGLCRELYRVVKPGGQLLALRDHVVSGPGQLDAFFAGHPLHRLYGGENAYTVAQYRGALVAAGFVVNRALGPFASPINFAPLTEATIRNEIIARTQRIPLAATVVGCLGFGVLRRLLNIIDRRPGRLWSFVCFRGT